MTESRIAVSLGRRVLNLAVRWLLPIAILAAFVVSGHLEQALSALADVQLHWAIPLLAVGVCLPLSHAWRWTYLLGRINITFSVAVSARVTALASLLNYAAPGFLGAPAKAFFAREARGIPVSRTLPTLAAEQLLDAVLLLLGGAIGILLAGPALLEYRGQVAETVDYRWFAASIFLVLLVSLISWRWGKRVFPGFMQALHDATTALFQSRRNGGLIAALTLARWFLDMAAFGMASLAVGLRLSAVEILLIANLALLAGLLAPVPGGLGVREAVLAALAGVVGAGVPAMLALSLVQRSALAIGLPVVIIASRAGERVEP